MPSPRLSLVLLAVALLPGCTLCWPRGEALDVCPADDDDTAIGDDDDSTAPDGDGMVSVPTTTGPMGCDPATSGDACSSDEGPAHEVTVSAFRIDAFEVARDEFVLFLNDHGNDCGGELCIGVFSDPEVDDATGTWVAPPDTARAPVMEVTWPGAAAYCAWVGKRLPTEAEWERAARGEDGRRYPWGQGLPDCKHAISGNGCDEGAPWDVDDGIRTAGRSPYGAWDMAGNAWEWVADRYSADYYDTSPSVDPQGPQTGSDRVVRGGGWESNDFALQSWSRWGRTPTMGNESVAFRCAADP